MLASLTIPGRRARRKKAIPHTRGADRIVSRIILAACLLVSMYTFSAFQAPHMSQLCKRNVRLYLLCECRSARRLQANGEIFRFALYAPRSRGGAFRPPLTRPYHGGMPKPNLGDPVAFGGNPTIGPKARNVIAVYFTQLLLPFWQEIFSCSDFYAIFTFLSRAGGPNNFSPERKANNDTSEILQIIYRIVTNPELTNHLHYGAQVGVYFT